MLRVVVFVGDAEKSQKIFKVAQEAVRKVNVKCELTYAKDAQKIIDNLEVTSSYYDVYVFNALNEECEKLAKRIRSVNLTSTIIYLSDNKMDSVLNIVKFRPSRVIFSNANASEIVESIRFACYEQLHFKPYFTVKSKESVMRIPYDNITYFESSQRKVTLCTRKKAFEFYAKLSDVLTLLPQDQFIKCHQSFVVNLAKVKELDKVNRCIKMISGEVIEISKSNYQQVVAQYNEYTERY